MITLSLGLAANSKWINQKLFNTIYSSCSVVCCAGFPKDNAGSRRVACTSKSCHRYILQTYGNELLKMIQLCNALFSFGKILRSTNLAEFTSKFIQEDRSFFCFTDDYFCRGIGVNIESAI